MNNKRKYVRTKKYNLNVHYQLVLEGPTDSAIDKVVGKKAIDTTTEGMLPTRTLRYTFYRRDAVDRATARLAKMRDSDDMPSLGWTIEVEGQKDEVKKDTIVFNATTQAS